MQLMGVSLVPVFLAALSTMVLGFLWYSPLLFARPWMLLMGYDPEDKTNLEKMRKEAGKSYAISFLASLVSAFVLGKIIAVTTVNSIAYGMKVGFGIWLGFVATVQLTDMLFSRRPVKLYLINTGYQLVCYLAMGAILAVCSRMF